MALRILVVDDSTVARTVARRALEARGASVTEASSAAEALAHDADRFDGALLDLELGDGTGLEVFDRMSKSGGGAKVAFLSATSDEAIVAAARSRAPLFAKPEGIVEAVEYLLR